MDHLHVHFNGRGFYRQLFGFGCARARLPVARSFRGSRGRCFWLVAATGDNRLAVRKFYPLRNTMLVLRANPTRKRTIFGAIIHCAALCCFVSLAWGGSATWL